MAFSDTAAAFAALPKQVKIGYQRFDFLLWQPNQANAMKAYGKYSPLESQIGLDTSISTPQKLAYTLLHELLHGASGLMEMAAEEKYSEEVVVSRFASGLSTIFADNSWLLPWLAEAFA